MMKRKEKEREAGMDGRMEGKKRKQAEAKAQGEGRDIGGNFTC